MRILRRKTIWEVAVINTSKTLKQIVEEHRDAIMKIRGVIGVGVGLSPSEPDRRCILVYTTTSDRPSGLPDAIEGHPVEIVIRKKGFHAL